MEELSTTTTFLAIAVLIPILYITTTNLIQGKSNKKLPPGPSFLEAFLPFMRAIKNRTLPILAREYAEKYGEIVFIRVPFMDMLFLNSAAATRELFAGKATEQFANDRHQTFVSTQLFKQKEVAFSSLSDPTWYRSRKLLFSALKFYGDGVAKFEATVQQELELLVSHVDTLSGTDIMPKDIIQTSILKLLALLLTGNLEERGSPTLQAMHDYNTYASQVLDVTFYFPASNFPFLVKTPGTKYKRIWDKLEAAQKTAKKYLVDDIKATFKENETRGIIDYLLHEQRKDGSDWMTDDHMWGIVMDILIGGNWTSVEVLTAMMFILVHHPDVMRKVQAEIDDVIGQRKPRLEDRSRCPYTEAAVMELNRYVGVVPVGLAHCMSQDVEFRGYFIPKGTAVFNNMWHFHKTEEIWGDPFNFRPERYLDNNGELLSALHPSRLNILPFGVGKRACPGETFARARIFLYVSTLLQQFDILPPGNEKLLPLNEDAWLLREAVELKPFYCQFRTRVD